MTVKARRRSRQRGAVAIIVVVALTLVMAAAALAVDISLLVSKRSEVQDAMDAAAAAAAQQLPGNPAQARLEAAKYANLNSPGLGTAGAPHYFATQLRCVFPMKSNGTPDWKAAKSQCHMDASVASPLDSPYPDYQCNDTMCSMYCPDDKACNTIVVWANGENDVDYYFGPAIGQPHGSTGPIISAACRGTCGKPTANPMNIVVLADRTASMKPDAIVAMKAGMKDMLTLMSRDQQFVAFGTIHASVKYNGCTTAVVGKGRGAYSQAMNAARTKFVGEWVPTDFSNTYTVGNADDGTLAVNTADPVYQAIDCLEDYGKFSGLYPGYPVTYFYPSDANGLGTHLASALKGAARKLFISNNIATLDASHTRDGLGEPRNVIILETDGRPEELMNNDDPGVFNIHNDQDIGNQSIPQACKNVVKMANQLKTDADNPVTILTIGYDRINEDTYVCEKGKPVRDTIAAVASPDGNNNASTARDCRPAGESDAENTDGDNYFCAANKEQLREVFSTALGSVAGRSQLMALPGINGY